MAKKKVSSKDLKSPNLKSQVSKSETPKSPNLKSETLKSANLKSEIKPKPAPKPKATRAIKTVVRPGRCPKCESTRRAGYTSIVTRDIAGTIDGHAYTHITWKRTKCRDCGQHRVDLFHENRPAS